MRRLVFFFHLFITFCTKIYITTSYTVYQHINMYSFIFPMCEYKPLYIMLFKDKKKREEIKNRDEFLIGKRIIMITRIKRIFLRSR